MANLRSKVKSVAGKKSKKAASKMLVPKIPLPVTLLSGFLGSGKTTLLQHILRSKHGLRIAVVVNDVGAINIDATLIKKTHQLTKTDEKIVALQNGCICCTLRGDLLEELPEQVAETFDTRLAEHMGDMAAAPGAQQLDDSMVKVLKQLKQAGGLEKFARLDTTVTVIDAFTMLHDFDTADLLSSRRDDVTPEDERTVSDLMVDQIEFADVIVLNKTDMIDDAKKQETKSLVRKLNHRAKILEASYGKVDVGELVNTSMFKLDVAQSGYGWLQDLHAMSVREVNGRNVLTPKPETEEYNVQSFIYSRYRPFHPRRLFALLYDKFILQMEHPDDDEEEDDDGDDEDGQEGGGRMDDVDMDDHDDSHSSDSTAGTAGRDSPLASSPQSSRSTAGTVPSPNLNSMSRCDEEDAQMELDPLDIPPNDVILATKRAHPTLRRLFRSKGEYHLATRPHRAGDWSQAGAMLTLTGGRAWFCTLDVAEYTTGDDEVDALVQHDMAKGGEWGDRRQELVFIGEGLDTAALEGMLDACLLTDAEFGRWQGVMRDGGMDEAQRRQALEDMFEDGFPDWAADVEDVNDMDFEDHEGHVHGHADADAHFHSHHDHSHSHGRKGSRIRAAA
ncbi:putative metal chaperone YciC [Tolypocladium ophioglossoides CBS 100239]|uniref:Putative metal chaperone YciC n=1 Tax=Tolypocladium ophioglossoides (strain CBS 100239) TaxID=1163406 RepID=A0A0L0NCF6_TOLOC|nr:putative metal chaperone YciC [Tolypocladium ophioglossoides CBS 100239]